MTDILFQERITIDVNKKTVLISGTASGIGLATARKYLSKGYEVCGIDIERNESEPQIDSFFCDISDEAAVKNVFIQISEKYQCINYLVNCAGIFFDKARYYIEDMCLSEFDRVISVNLAGTILVTKFAIPLLRTALGDKAIVNVSSDQAIYPRKRNSAYAVSKAGILNFSLACATELLEDRIRVNTVLPASVRSGFLRNFSCSGTNISKIYKKEEERIPFGIIEPEEVANLIFFLGSENSKKITGQSIMMNSGLYL